MRNAVDDNDTDEFGMDAHARRRLRVRRFLRNTKKKPSKPRSDHVPGKYRVEQRMDFPTLGAKGSGTEDRVGYVTGIFFHSSPEFARSIVEKHRNRNGWVLRGAWPNSGKKVFDWEWDISGDRKPEVAVKFNMWDKDGNNDGQTYRVTVATAKKASKKFLEKIFHPALRRAKMSARESIQFTPSEYLVMIHEVCETMVESLFEGKMTPYQKAQQNRRQTVATHTRNPAGQSTFYKHAVRAIFNKLRKDGESFRGAAKGGQLIAQWMLKKHGYAHGSIKDPWADGGKMTLTSKGRRRNRKHNAEPNGTLRKKAAAYDHIMGIRRRQAAKQQATSNQAKGAG